MNRKEISGAVLEMVQGNITKLEAAAIANAANPRLVGGGGVDGAIQRLATPLLATSEWISIRCSLRQEVRPGPETGEKTETAEEWDLTG